MRQINITIWVCFACALLLVSGCGRHYVTKDRTDFYMAPDIKQLSDKVTVVTDILNPVVDLAEGGGGKFAWKKVVWRKDGTEENYLALSLDLRNDKCSKTLITIIPRPLAELDGSYHGNVNHAGTKMYNSMAVPRKLEKLSKKIKPTDKAWQGFFQPIAAAPNIKEVSIDSQEFKDIVSLYQKYRINEVKLAREYVFKKYGSNLTDKQLDALAKEDSIVTSFIDWLGRDWKIFLTFPFTSFQGAAIMTGIVKVITLPSIWGDKLTKPGYAEYIMTAEDSAEMFFRGQKEYGTCFK